MIYGYFKHQSFNEVFSSKILMQNFFAVVILFNCGYMLGVGLFKMIYEYFEYQSFNEVFSSKILMQNVLAVVIF